MTSEIPPQQRALVLESTDVGFDIKIVPVPRPTDGSAVVQILAAAVLSYHRDVYNGQRHLSFPMPLIGGIGAIGRVAALGPDATVLERGQLVYVDCVVHARDNPDVLFLSAIHEGSTDGSKKLMRDVWRDGTFAEYAKVPLENCIRLNEARLCGSLGYSFQDLMYLCYLLVPYGGLRDIGLEPGETVIISPATGGFGGAGVQVAVAIGARVIAMGRNEDELARVKAHVIRGTPGASVETVPITKDGHVDTAVLKGFGTIDAFLDISPPAAAKSAHFKSAMGALRRGGRCSAMGIVDAPIIDRIFVGSNLTLKGKLMYEREDMLQFVKMLEMGLFPKGKDFVDVKRFGLGDWREAFDTAAEHTGIGKLVVIVP